MSTHFGILAKEYPMDRGPGRLLSMDCKDSDTTEQLSTIQEIITFMKFKND